jgi:YidC/Oxa1 family membrane protein insertase
MLTVHRILFFWFALPALLMAQGVTESFGEPGQPGSFNVRFSRAGAGIYWVQATDHYVSVEASHREVKEPSDYLLLVENQDHALRLSQAAGGLFAKDPSTAQWEMQPVADGLKFTLADGQGLVLEKTYHYDQAARGFRLELTLRNESSDARGNQAFSLGGPALISPKQASFFGDVSVAIAAPAQNGDEYAVLKPSPEVVSQVLPADLGNLAFAGSTNRFFGAFVWPVDLASLNALTQLSVQTIAPRRGVSPPDNLTTRVNYGLSFQIPAKTESVTLSYGLYLGPKSARVFETLPDSVRQAVALNSADDMDDSDASSRFGPILDNDLSPPCCGGITIPGGRPMAKLLLSLLGVFYDFLGNWGFAIILLTILVRGAMFPLNFRMQKSMRAYGAKMGKLKPQMDEMKKRYADDQKAYQQAMIQFQRENKVFPPIGGCLPIFLTMPIYLGLFTALRTAYDLRQQPFLSWVDDLSTSDALFQLGFWPDEFNLLPLLWIALFVTMTLRQPLPADPQQRQMQMMMRFMPIMFGVMLYTYASALLLYMVTSMLWSLVESAIVKKILGPADPNSAMMAPTPM